MKKNIFYPITILTFMLSMNLLAQNNEIQGQNFNPLTSNVFPANGNTGIGTTNPDNMLTIQDSNYNSGFFLSMGDVAHLNRRNYNFGNTNGTVGHTAYTDNGELRLEFTANTSTTSFGISDNNGVEVFKASKEPLLGSFIHLPQADSRIVIGDYGTYLSSAGYKFVVKSGSAMIEGNILTEANVGIGTNLFVDGGDTYRLSVNGRIRAEGVKVYTGWADFVFEDDYKLPTLKEVEDHIKAFGHLENIPSAKEVEKNGIELGEMNKLLLQKIEELTLYLIEKDKQMEKLNLAVERLEAINNDK